MELKFWENVHPPKHVTCHMSHGTCHVSHVTCHLSHVTCHLSPVTCHLSPVTCHMYFFFNFSLFFLSYKKIGQSGGASRWRVCYQRGIRCLFPTPQRLQNMPFIAFGRAGTCLFLSDQWKYQLVTSWMGCNMTMAWLRRGHFKIHSSHACPKLFKYGSPL